MGDRSSSEQRGTPGGVIVLAPHSAAWAAAFDRDAYSDGKTAFILAVERRASAWRERIERAS